MKETRGGPRLFLIRQPKVLAGPKNKAAPELSKPELLRAFHGRPDPPPAANTIGTTGAACIAAITAGVPPVTMMSTLSRTNSAVTGLSVLSVDLAGKRLNLLREAIPSLGRLAIMGNVGNPIIVLELGELQAAARTLFQVDTLEIRRPQDIAPALEAVKGRADALYVCQDLLTRGNRLRINTLALAARLPVMWASGELIEAAGLMSYGPNFPDLYRRAGDYVDKILRGAKTRRFAGRAADEVRTSHQPDHRAGARPRSAGDSARARRRGDRVRDFCGTA